MIQASVSGRLGKDAQSIETRTGTPMAAASLAVDVSPRDAESTVWVRVVAFGRIAEALCKHLKGETLAASGRLELSRWTGSDGQERESWNLIADSIHSARTARARASHRPTNKTPTPETTDTGVPFDDPLPF